MHKLIADKSNTSVKGNTSRQIIRQFHYSKIAEVIESTL
jgi:hypothetical protein